MGDFGRLAGMGTAQPRWYPLNLFRLGPFGYVHIAPDVGATSFPAPRGK